MSIYISTGGYGNEDISLVLKKLKNQNIKNIELSGGIYNKKIDQILLKNKKFFNFVIHNYFPVPKLPFVLNLASADKLISRLTIGHIKKSMRLAKKIGSKYYSVHAGFLCDIHHSELGKKIKKKKLNNKKKSIDNFLKNLKKISIYSKKLKIDVMVENNVVTKGNIREFGRNPLLMCSPKESYLLLKKFPRNIKMLLDVGHLNVSAKTLRFKREEMFRLCKNFIKGYHISDNNGIVDSNNKFNSKSWFWKYLNKNLDYYSIEVYNVNEKKLIYLKKILSNKVNV